MSAGRRAPEPCPGAGHQRQPDAEHRSHVQAPGTSGQPDAEHRTRFQALAFRVARHHLAERTGDPAAAAVVGLQDTPPGTAAIALAARADVGPEALGELVLVPSVRGAPLAVAPSDLPVFTAGLAPPDEAAARAVIGNAWKALDGIAAMEALDRVSDAVRDSLADGPLAARRLPPGAARAPARRAALVVQGLRQPPRASVAVARHRDPRGARRSSAVRAAPRCSAPRRRSRRASTPAPGSRGASSTPTAPRARGSSRHGPGSRRPTPRRCGSGPANWPRSTSKGPPRGCSPRTRRRSPTRRPRGRAAPAEPRSARARVATASSWCRTRRSASGSGRVLGGPGMLLADGAVAGLWRAAKQGPPARRDGRAARAAQQGGEGRGRGGGGAPRPVPRGGLERGDLGLDDREKTLRCSASG